MIRFLQVTLDGVGEKLVTIRSKVRPAQGCRERIRYGTETACVRES